MISIFPTFQDFEDAFNNVNEFSANNLAKVPTNMNFVFFAL
jgi:hypothetical protein